MTPTPTLWTPDLQWARRLARANHKAGALLTDNVIAVTKAICRKDIPWGVADLEAIMRTVIDECNRCRWEVRA
jgi:hypothetical protein